MNINGEMDNWTTLKRAFKIFNHYLKELPKYVIIYTCIILNNFHSTKERQHHKFLKEIKTR